MMRFSPYELQDFIACELARIYSAEYKEPFFVSVGRFSDFDISSLSRKIKVEVKADAMAAKTDNAALEYWNTELNEPAGILRTSATQWLHLVPDQVGFSAFEFDVPVLRRLVVELGEIRSHGNARFKIIPLNVLKKHVRRTFPFDSKFFEDFQLQQSR